MSLAGWCVIGAWLIGGLGVGVAVGVWQRREGDEASGAAALAAWMLAPLVVAAALLVGLGWLLHRLVALTDDRLAAARPSRQALEDRIAELERDTEMTP